MEKEILDNNGVLNEDDAVSLLADVGVRDGDIDKLQWSIVYNLTNARASLAERNTPIAQIFDLYSVYFALAGGKGQHSCPFKCCRICVHAGYGNEFVNGHLCVHSRWHNCHHF